MMNDWLDLIRRTVREELALHRGPQLGTVTAMSAHESEDDTANYECDVRLKHDGLELAKVPISAPHIGAAMPPRVGDLVLVSFLDHDIQQPLVTGRFYNDGDGARAPLFKADDVLFEQRLSDGKLNHLRMAADGSIFIQRDVTKPEDNSEFKAGVRIDPEGLIELKSGDDFVLTIDPGNGKVSILSKDKDLEFTCQTLTIDGDVHMKKKLTVDGDGKISGITISGTDISG
ncbi:MAG: hypothetical protein JF607_04815 [Burkholderiales bacterium]|jgi:hypothetical protein|nr:hypothetical protein [Burkholderiales bacterium]